MASIDRRSLFRTGAGLAAGATVAGLAPGFASPAAATVRVGKAGIPDDRFAYFGVYSPDNTAGIGQPERLEAPDPYLGRMLAINHVFFNADDVNDVQPPTTVAQAFIPVAARMTQDIGDGRIPLLSYGLGRDGTGEDSATDRLHAIATSNPTAMKRISDLAVELKKLGNRAIFFRFSWEVDTSSRYKDHASDYVLAYRNARTVFDNAGLTNVSWVWCPSRLAFGNVNAKNGANNFYPGSDVVDWIGCDGYSREVDSILGAWPSFEELFTGAHAYSMQMGKPFMVAETGVVRKITNPADENQAKYYKHLWENLRDLKFPKLKGLVLWNMDEDTLYRFDMRSYNAGALAQVVNIGHANRMSMMRDDLTH